MDHQSTEDALRRRREREREHCARETPEQREARLSQRCMIGNADCVIGNGQGNSSLPKQQRPLDSMREVIDAGSTRF